MSADLRIDTPPPPPPATSRRGGPLRRDNRLGRIVLTTIVLGWFALLILVPILALVRRALDGGFATLLTSLGSPEMRRAFTLSLATTAFATLINTLFGVAFAIVLVRHRFFGRTLADGLVDLPFAVSPIVAGLMLVVLYGPEGWLGSWLEAHGIQVVYAIPGMVIATTFVTLPFVVREVVPVLEEIGLEQEEAAYTLGAGRWQTFLRVTLPSIRWGVAYGMALTIARSLGEFGALIVVSGNLIGRTQTATLAIHDGIESYAPEGAYAASLVLAAISFVLLIGMELIRKNLEGRKVTGP